MSYSDQALRAEVAPCSGCGLCQLVCPVWHQRRDVRLTPLGRAKALQHGVPITALSEAMDACTLCGACDPVCPESIPLSASMLAWRNQQPLGEVAMSVQPAVASAGARGSSLLVAGRSLGADGARLQRAAQMLGVQPASDHGADIALAVEAGALVDDSRLAAFLGPLRRARRLVVADGLLLRSLRTWLPGLDIAALGHALSGLPALRARLRRTDLYVIEPRAFHMDHARLLPHYDALQRAFGGTTNLDLHRMAIPTTASAAQHALGRMSISPEAQARWILDGRHVERVVVEDEQDIAPFVAVVALPVLHIADLAENPPVQS